MAFQNGRQCQVAVDQYDLTAIFRSMGFSCDVDTADSTVFGLNDKTFEPGLRSSSVTLDGFYDTVQQPNVEARVGQAAPFVATVGPAGLAVGARARLVSVNTTNATTTTGIGDLALLNWALQSTDRIGLGYALVNSAVAMSGGDYTGTAVDTGAAVTGASWAAHFHLHTLASGTVTITVQDSADGVSGWANITSVTSGALAVASAVRVTGTGTVKRYVRVFADFSGTQAGTATVAFSRA